MRLHHRLVLLAAAPLALAAFLGTAPGASAGVGLNGVGLNSLTSNSLTSNALTSTGSALVDLDGVQVEAVTLPVTAQ